MQRVGMVGPVPFFGHKFRREREWDEVRASAQDDLVALGEEIRGLDVDISMPGASAEAKQRYDQALQAYQRASQIFDGARRPEDLAPVSETLEEGRYAMSYAKALLEGRPPPERRAPCFFDPRHGPSTEDVEWAPPGGTARPVPACAADAIRIREGFAPHGPAGECQRASDRLLERPRPLRSDDGRLLQRLRRWLADVDAPDGLGTWRRTWPRRGAGGGSLRRR